MRLHQPDRPVQPLEHVHRPRGRCPRFPDYPVLDQRLLGAAHSELASPGLEREEVRFYPLTRASLWIRTCGGSYHSNGAVLTIPFSQDL